MIYFASDLHLGLHKGVPAAQRERYIVDWLKEIAPSAEKLYLLGDIFDFWYEYKRIVPAGFVRFLGQIAQMVDDGIEVIFLTGNHDVWMYGYFEREIGVKILHETTEIKLGDTRVSLAHGDGLGSKDRLYSAMRWCFHNRLIQRLFTFFVPPSWTMRVGQGWSTYRRSKHPLTHKFQGDNEPVVRYTKKDCQETGVRFHIIGHLHQARLEDYGDEGVLIVLGDWITLNTYLVWDGGVLTLCKYLGKGESPKELAKIECR